MVGEDEVSGMIGIILVVGLTLIGFVFGCYELWDLLHGRTK